MVFKKQEKQENPAKMLQVNSVDVGGKLNINVRRKGFSPVEAMGVLELAKMQIKESMNTKKNFGVSFKKDKGDDKDKGQ